MRVSIHRGLSGQAAAAPAMGNAMLVVTGAEFLLSMVEARWAAKNGDGRKMDAGHKSQQELQKIEQQLKKVQSLDGQDESTHREIQQLQERIELLRKQMSAHFSAWEKTELARHPQRPYALDYIERIFSEWSEIHGDRGYADDAAILREMARLEIPIITVITGEGGSGGALAIAVADRVLMMENSIYSVISPEGCASIMWRDSSKKELAAQALRITAKDLTEMGCVDG